MLSEAWHDSRNRPLRRFLPVALMLLALILAVGGCAGAPPDGGPAAAAAADPNDPLEAINRAVFDFNLAFDAVLLKPAAFAWREAMPQAGRDAVTNLLDHLRLPVVFANDLLQGEAARALVTLNRFAINTAFGALGLADVATDLGFPRHDEDFGQTLAVWGTRPGPYLMLPVLGPSNPRDALGLLADFLADPFNRTLANTGRGEASVARSGMRGVDIRARNYDTINEAQRTSLDFYATTRSVYRQRRADEIANGVPSANRPAPTLSTDGENSAPNEELTRAD